MMAINRDLWVCIGKWQDPRTVEMKLLKLLYQLNKTKDVFDKFDPILYQLFRLLKIREKRRSPRYCEDKMLIVRSKNAFIKP